MVPTDITGQYWDVLDVFDAHVAMLDRDGVIVAVNAAWERFASENGRALTSCGVGRSYLAACQSDETDQDAGAAADGISRVLSGTLPIFTMEYPCHTPDKERWFSMMVRPLRRSDSSDAVVIHTDVTSLHIAKEREGHEQRRFVSLIEHAVDLITVMDQDGTITYESPAFERMLGYATPMAAGTDAFTFLHPDDVELFRTALADTALVPAGSILREYRMRHRDGSWRWIEADLTNCLDDPEICGIVVNSRDITARKETEMDRAQRAESFSTLFDATAEAMVIHDGTVFVAVNQAYADLIGLEPDQVAGGPLLELVAPASQVLAVEQMRARSEVPYDLVAQRADGSTFLVEFLGRPIRYEDRWLRLSTMRDVTQQRADEAALRASEARQSLLFHLVQAQRETRDPDLMMVTASEALARYLGTHRVGFFEMVDDTMMIATACWTDGTLPPLSGTIPLIGFGGEDASEVRDDHTVSITDMLSDPRTADAAFETFGARAGIGVPIIRGERVQAVLYVGHANVREWRVDEVALARDVAEQTWDAVERGRAEIALRESEARFRAVWEATSDAIALSAPDGTVLAANPAYQALYGYDETAIVGHSFAVIFPEEYRAWAEDQHRGLFASQEPPQVFEAEVRRKDGVIRSVEARADFVIEGGQPTALVSVVRDVTDRRVAEAALQASEERLRLALEAAEMGVFLWDPVTDRTDADSRLLQMVGLDTSDEFSLKTAVSRYIDVRDRERYAAAVRAMLDPTGPGRLDEEVCWTGTDGCKRWLAFSGQSFFEGTDATKRAVRVVGGVFDVTTRKRVEEALRTSEVRFRALVQDASDIVIVLDAEGKFRYGSQALERVLGYSAASFANAVCLDVVHPDDLETVERVWQTVTQTPASRVQITYRTKNVDGVWFWLDGIMTNLLDVPEVAGIVINVRDVTEQKRLESQLRHLALHDPLTGLPNRTLLADRMEQALQLAAADGHRVGLLFLDVDYFKQVNDTFGHAVGDKLLQSIADRLRSVVQVSDTVARIGGDEFVLLAPRIGSEGHATELAERVQAAMAAPFVWHGHEVVVGVTIGIAVSEPGLKHPEILLRDGDAALYRAKHAGRGRSVVHVSETSETTGNAKRRWRLKTDVGEAADRGELMMHYQPIVTLTSGDVTGMEALLRWEHPVHGLISPDEFIPLAEEAGQIVALGLWGMAKVCETLSQWGSRAPEIGLNLSATQFNDPTLMSALIAQVARTGIDPRKLRLEITEHMVIEDIVGTVSTLNQVRKLGVGVSIDDFGSGYSSLRYLRELPVTGVKLDRSFVHGLETDPGAQAMVKGIVSLAHAIGLSVTAEGIETAGQLALLRAIGCDQGQGFYLARPGPVSTEGPTLRVDVPVDPPWTSSATGSA